jgi:hypothetical protein
MIKTSLSLLTWKKQQLKVQHADKYAILKHWEFHETAQAT